MVPNPIKLLAFHLKPLFWRRKKKKKKRKRRRERREKKVEVEYFVQTFYVKRF